MKSAHKQNVKIHIYLYILSTQQMYLLNTCLQQLPPGSFK